MLDRLLELQFTIVSVKSLLKNTGWLSLLGDFMRLSELSTYLEQFYKKSAEILNTNSHQPGLNVKSTAYSAIRGCGAADLIALNQQPKKMVQATRNIESKEFKNKIISRIQEDMAKICKAQAALGINIIDPKMVEIFLSGNPASATITNSSQPQPAISYKKMKPLPLTPIHKLIEKTGRIRATPVDIIKLNANFEEILKALILKDYTGVIKLVVAVAGENPALVSYSLSNMTDTRKNTLMHHMIRLNHYDQCVWLIANKASVLLRNSVDLTAFDIAAGFLLRDREENKGIRLFFEFCDHAHQETQLNDEVLKPYEVLHTLSNGPVDELKRNLKNYKTTQADRFASNFWWIKRTALDFLGLDHTVARAQEVAKTYFFLNQLQDTQNYLDLVEQLQQMLRDHDKCSKGSVLHQLIRETLQRVNEVIKTEEDAFQKELDQYKIQYRVMQINEIEGRDQLTRAELKKRDDTIQKEKKQNSDSATLIEELTETKKVLQAKIDASEENTNRKLQELESRLIARFSATSSHPSTPPCEMSQFKY